MFLFYSLLTRAQAYLTAEQIDFLAEAYLFAADAHETQIRSTGEAYITHPMAVACILADMHMDAEMLAAAIMHDVVEDTAVSLEDIEEIFGSKVAKLVDGVTKLTTLQHMGKAKLQAESFRKMVLAMSSDIRVILIKLADRLHNMRTLSTLRQEKRHRIGKETLEIYAPIANRLGMYALKNQLEDLAFEAMFPLRSRVLREYVRAATGNRKRILEKILHFLQEKMAENGISPERVQGRQKRLYSIFRKMRYKGLPFSEIMDVYAFRILADDDQDCYRILGLVHSIFKPVPGRFKDYIAIPKANGYQSLHTTLFGPHGVPIEIQIRTQKMHAVAENGIAAHWLYKDEYYRSATEVKTREWLQKLLDMQSKTRDSFEFVENVKIDLFPDEVYVFTPKGEIMELPARATVLDFAYAVHTEIGNHCTAAKVNRRLVPFNHLLSNGDHVEIITSKHASPSPTWLNYVETGKAKTAIKHHLKEQREAETVNLGQKLLRFGLSELGLFWEDISALEQQHVLTILGYENERALFKAIGLGELTGSGAALTIFNTKQAKWQQAAEAVDNTIRISGAEQGEIRYCQHCWPLPGDDISGLLQKGGVLEVHTTTCKVLKNASNAADTPPEILPLSWANKIMGVFAVKLRLDMQNITGGLAKVTRILADMQVNIKDFSLMQVEQMHAVLDMVIEVESRKHLAQILRRLRRLPVVMRLKSLRQEENIPVEQNL